MTSLLDPLIVAVYLTAILLTGLLIGRRDRSLDEYALGNRRMPWWAVMASIIAAETSAATFLGAPGEGYKSGSIAYAQLIVGLIIGRVIVAFVFLKPFYAYRVRTVYDYLLVRFGPVSRAYLSGVFLVMRTLASGTRLFVPSLVMVLAWQKMWGRPAAAPSTLAPYGWAIAAVTLLTCVYTAVGGMKAVIWTDLIQATLMFGSAVVAVVLISHQIGGLTRLGDYVPSMKAHTGYFVLGWEDEKVRAFQSAQQVGHMSAWQYVRLILGSDFTLFSAVIAATFGSVAAFGTDQDMVQRMLSAPDFRASRRSLIWASFMDIPVAAGFALIGVLLSAYYRIDPTYRPASTADVFASYILNVMPAGVRGLTLAGVLATAMGSLSAALNALATTAVNDWYIPWLAPESSEPQRVRAARVSTVLFAVVMCGIAMAFAQVKITDPTVRIIPVVVGIAGLLSGPMLGVFLVGMLTRRGSDLGNAVGLTAGLIGVLFVSGQYAALGTTFGLQLPVPSWLPPIAWPWFPMIGCVTTFGVSVCFTPISNAKGRSREANLPQMQTDGHR